MDQRHQLLMAGPLSMGASFYNNDEHFASAVQRTLELKRDQVAAELRG